MDAAKALEKIKEALDSGMGPLPTLGMIRETVAEMFPPAPAPAPPSDLKMVAAQAGQGKSASPFLKMKPGAVLKFMSNPNTDWLYHKYMLGAPQPAYNAMVGPDGKVTPVPVSAPVSASWQGHKPVGVIYDEMTEWKSPAPDWEADFLKAKELAEKYDKPVVVAQQKKPSGEQLKDLTAQLVDAKPVVDQMTTLMKQMSASFTTTIKPEDVELWKTMLGEKPQSPND